MKPFSKQVAPWLAALLVVATCGTAMACNIPVFRYALERWRSDNLKMVVVYRGSLSEQDRGLVEAIEQKSLYSGGNANVVVVPIDVAGDERPKEFENLVAAASPSLKDPQAILVGSSASGTQIVLWQGSLEQSLDAWIYESTARTELVKRLQSGQAAVWVLISGKTPEETESTEKMLKAELSRLSEEVPFPDGIGEPGSELYSEVPLTMEFSLITVSRDDATERFLTQLASRLAPEEYAAGHPIAIPVFGRGRALEVIPAERLTPLLVNDLCYYLSGACSCQVKEQNPGFDLLTSTNWETALFEEGVLPPDTGLLHQRRSESQPAETVPIAPGNIETSNIPQDETAPTGSVEAHVDAPGSGSLVGWLALAIVVVGAVIAMTHRT
ncbi:MAG: hypothetical protein R3C18_11365 [Planctomycetaceae bacterium]